HGVLLDPTHYRRLAEISANVIISGIRRAAGQWQWSLSLGRSNFLVLTIEQGSDVLPRAGCTTECSHCRVRTDPRPAVRLVGVVDRGGDYVDAGTSNRVHQRLRGLGQDP